MTRKELQAGLDKFVEACKGHSHACLNLGASSQLVTFRAMGHALSLIHI